MNYCKNCGLRKITRESTSMKTESAISAISMTNTGNG